MGAPVHPSVLLDGGGNVECKGGGVVELGLLRVRGKGEGRGRGTGTDRG